MKKPGWKIPQPLLLVTLLIVCSVGFPILMLQLDDLSRFGRVQQEPLPYNLNVEQEPYSVAEKMEMFSSYEERREDMTMAEQSLEGSGLWNSGTVEDVVSKKLAAICGDMGVSVPDVELLYGTMVTLTDRKKPTLSLRIWSVSLQGENEFVELCLDVDTGSVYAFFTNWLSSDVKPYEVSTDRIFRAMTGQIDGADSWYQQGDQVIFLDNSGIAIFDIVHDERAYGWNVIGGAKQTNLMEDAEKYGIYLPEEIIQSWLQTEAPGYDMEIG